MSLSNQRIVRLPVAARSASRPTSSGGVQVSRVAQTHPAQTCEAAACRLWERPLDQKDSSRCFPGAPAIEGFSDDDCLSRDRSDSPRSLAPTRLQPAASRADRLVPAFPWRFSVSSSAGPRTGEFQPMRHSRCPRSRNGSSYLPYGLSVVA